MEAKDLISLGLESEHVLCLIHSAIYKFGPQNFVGLKPAALSTLIYWGTARFEEVRELGKLVKKELPMKLEFIRANQIKQRSSISL